MTSLPLLSREGVDGRDKPGRPDWFPDWRGEACVIVAAGPSAKLSNLDAMRGRARVIVINRSHELAPWADVLYACDGAFWDQYPAALAFAGLKVTQHAGAAAERPCLKLVTLQKKRADVAVNEIVAGPPGTIGGGCNSGFQATNLAVQFGVSRIVWVGFDMHARDGVHWHDPHRTNPGASDLLAWARILDQAAPQLAALGVTVLNATLGSALTAYPIVSLEQALA